MVNNLIFFETFYSGGEIGSERKTDKKIIEDVKSNYIILTDSFKQ